ncbi:hypothetical protein HYV81_00890 [Candidatus Woesearchaeota archaeon]|nr:hypothetical protein [Candidatus Woesearchaeota archaeon]
MFEVKLCRTRAALSAKPVKQLRLNLARLSGKFEVVVTTPVAAVLKVNNEDIVVHQYGEIFFKKLKDEAAIIKIVQDIYKVAVVENA